MMAFRFFLVSAAAVAVFVAAGCGGTGQVLHRQASETCDRLEAKASADAGGRASARPAQGESARAAEPRQGDMFFSLRDEPAPIDPAPAATDPVAESRHPAEAPSAEGKPAKATMEFPPLRGATFGEIFKADLREAPGRLWNGTKLSFGNLTNVAILSASFGVDRIVRNNVDDGVRHHLQDHPHTSLRETGDFGEIAGHPVLHFAAASAWYFWSVNTRNDKDHALSKVLIEALAINDLSTGLLQVSVNQHDPRGDKYGWPSGHTSSSFCVASVLHEYYGWQAGVPAYLVAGYLAATRVGDRRHNVSDVVFGTALGLVIGHSVAKGELPQIGGFTILPYGGPEGGGLMFMKQW